MPGLTVWLFTMDKHPLKKEASSLQGKTAATCVGASPSRDMRAVIAHADPQKKGSCSPMKTSEPLREETDLKIAEVTTSPAWCSHLGSSQTWPWAVEAES